MSKFISFEFCDGDGNDYPIIVMVKENLSEEQMKEIENAAKDYIHNYKDWDTDDAVIYEVMNLFDYPWEFVCVDKVINCNK